MDKHSLLLKDIRLTEKEILFWTKDAIPSEPHEELIPWVGLLRPLTNTNWTWVHAWPEEDWLRL